MSIGLAEEPAEYAEEGEVSSDSLPDQVFTLSVELRIGAPRESLAARYRSRFLALSRARRVRLPFGAWQSRSRRMHRSQRDEYVGD